jgi:hypothetical protein
LARDEDLALRRGSGTKAIPSYPGLAMQPDDMDRPSSAGPRRDTELQHSSRPRAAAHKCGSSIWQIMHFERRRGRQCSER